MNSVPVGSGHLRRLMPASVLVLDRTAFCETPATCLPSPQQLTSFMFSRVVVLVRRENRSMLIVRLASTRTRPIANVSAQLSWLEKVEMNTGPSYRRLIELPLLRAHNPQLVFSWTLVHEIEEGSATLEALCGDGEFRLTVTVSGIDMLLASQALGGQSYRRADMLIDHEFDDMIDQHRPVRIRLHQTT
ncbi:hypothetical protein [Rhodanobacter sp. MP1X3]|uniref:hypothetical protein n=1 Tax=Rhodanobacter sp. MP1X3 TaxID=2723086 RepID=UPI00160E0986|nr:hypothetical protein [Rhodanobacter sp. MP1X3]MBB6244891.1 hypothetical protein [Rhodanobacter sp. MP1X3]